MPASKTISRSRLDPILAAIVLVGAVVGSLVVAKARNWSVMTDELLYTGMARSIAHSIFPLAQVRGASVAVNQILFPTIIAPLVGGLSMPDAYPWIAALNAVIFATAAIPAYMLTNLVTENRGAARWVAVCTIVTPWLALASKALPDPAAYVAVLWAAYAMVRTSGATEKPLKGDLLTLLAIALAYLCRNQFLLLVGVWIGAVVLIRIAQTLGETSWRDVPRALLTLPRDRPIPCATFVLVFLIVKLEPSWLLGLYTVTTTGARGGAAPSGIVHSFFNHASVVALGIAGLPFVLGLPWLAAALGRVTERAQNDAAIVIVLLSCAVLFVGASFDLRFTESDRVIERYVFYFAPLMLVAMAAFFAHPPKRLIAFAVPAIAGLYLLNVSQPYGLNTPLFFEINQAFSPVQIALVGYQQVADTFGLSIFGMFTIVLIVAAGVTWWLVESDRRSLAMNLAFALVFLVIGASAVYAVPKIVKLQNTSANHIFGVRSADQKAWIDAATNGATTSLAYTPRNLVGDPAKAKDAERVSNWWDLVFWNAKISDVYVPIGSNPRAHSPFPGPAYTMLPDWSSGELMRAPGDDSHYLAQSETDPNFAPQSTGPPARRSGFVIYDTGKPATAAWATKGLTARGWIPPGGATLRVWAPRGAKGSSHLHVIVKSATTKRPRKSSRIWPVAIPAGGHVDIPLRRGPGPTHVESIRLTSAG
jgi:hypothetical protein